VTGALRPKLTFNHLHNAFQPAQALKEWGTPVDIESLSSLFVRYLQTDRSAPTTPFCDMPISPESASILEHLIALNSAQKGWWTVGSQPAVDAAKSEDPIHGFGPRGGYVFQKSFVEFFVKNKEEADRLLERVEKEPNGRISCYAGNKQVRASTRVD
jgi:methylenetetrahydrofolate reductase (NADPH)